MQNPTSTGGSENNVASERNGALQKCGRWSRAGEAEFMELGGRPLIRASTLCPHAIAAISALPVQLLQSSCTMQRWAAAASPALLAEAIRAGGAACWSALGPAARLCSSAPGPSDGKKLTQKQSHEESESRVSASQQSQQQGSCESPAPSDSPPATAAPPTTDTKGATDTFRAGSSAESSDTQPMEPLKASQAACNSQPTAGHISTRQQTAASAADLKAEAVTKRPGDGFDDVKSSGSNQAATTSTPPSHSAEAGQAAAMSQEGQGSVADQAGSRQPRASASASPGQQASAEALVHITSSAMQAWQRLSRQASDAWQQARANSLRVAGQAGQSQGPPTTTSSMGQGGSEAGVKAAAGQGSATAASPVEGRSSGSEQAKGGAAAPVDAPSATSAAPLAQGGTGGPVDLAATGGQAGVAAATAELSAQGSRVTTQALSEAMAARLAHYGRLLNELTGYTGG